jgi:hypothetical protein
MRWSFERPVHSETRPMLNAQLSAFADVRRLSAGRSFCDRDWTFISPPLRAGACSLICEMRHISHNGERYLDACRWTTGQTFTSESDVPTASMISHL